jgi:hypothetical protein
MDDQSRVHHREEEAAIGQGGKRRVRSRELRQEAEEEHRRLGVREVG